MLEGKKSPSLVFTSLKKFCLELEPFYEFSPNMVVASDVKLDEFFWREICREIVQKFHAGLWV